MKTAIPERSTTPPADGISVTIMPNDKGSPNGKLADVEITFTAPGPLQGLRLLGFAVWERRSGTGRNVTMPARTYSVNGERRSFSLLRPQVSADNNHAQDAIRDRILGALTDFEARAAVADQPSAQQAAGLNTPADAPADLARTTRGRAIAAPAASIRTICRVSTAAGRPSGTTRDRGTP